MRPILIAAILTLLYTTASAQDETNELDLSFWAIKWRSTEITNPLNPCLQFGIEKRMGRNALELQLGYTIPITYRPSIAKYTDKKETQGISTRIEARRYVGEAPEGKGTFFVGVQALYTYYTTFYDLSNYDGSGQYRYDTYIMPVHVFGATVVSGIQKTLGKHLLIEMYSGFGIKRKVLKDKETSGPNVLYAIPLSIGKQSTASSPSYTTLALPVSLSLGYYF